MIVRKRPNAVALLFIVRGSVVPRVFPHLVAVGLFAALVSALHELELLKIPEFSLAPFTLLGVALSIFLGFRNNAAHERWWEARKQWGEMVSEIRSLARSSETLLNLDVEHSVESQLRHDLLRWAAAHCHALRGSLRGEDCGDDFGRWLNEEDVKQMLRHQNPADYCLRHAGQIIGELYRQQHIDSIGLRILDEHLTRLASVQAASERIATTPLPFAYTLLTHRTAYLYCYLLPFGLVPALGWYSMLFTIMVAYTFFGLDVLSEEMEEPFGRASNDLPLDALCRINDISLAESMGETPLPLLEPVKHVLQ